MLLEICRMREKRNSGVSGEQDEIFSDVARKTASMAAFRMSCVVRDARRDPPVVSAS